MSEVVVVGSFKSQPGKEGEAVEAVRALVERTHGEQGCILYGLHRGVDDPSRLAFIERWASREELDAHPVEPARAGVPDARRGALRGQRRHRGLRALAGR
jgi:quinol monooxygenase YgiN